MLGARGNIKLIISHFSEKVILYHVYGVIILPPPESAQRSITGSYFPRSFEML